MARAPHRLNLGGALYRVALEESLTPRLDAYLDESSKGAVRIMRTAAGKVRSLLRISADRYLRRRSGAGRRGIRALVTRTATGPVAIVWPSVGYLAAHELGSTIPAVEIRPRQARQLAWQVAGEWRYARVVRRPAFSLPRRPWMTAAEPQAQRVMVETLQAEYDKIPDAVGLRGRG